MKIRHIDNNFFKLTAVQAKQLTCDGKLPRRGYAKRAKAGAEIELEFLRGIPRVEKRITTDECWIERTPLSWWNGAEVPQGEVWALHAFKTAPAN